MPDFKVDDCQSCNAKVIWAVTTNARTMPVDAEPVQGGNIQLERRGENATPLAPREDLAADVAEPVSDAVFEQAAKAIDEDLAAMREAGLTFTPDLRAALPAASPFEPVPERVEVVLPKRRGRPPRTGAAAYAAPGEVLGAWRSYACRTCGNRRYEAHECCGGPAEPVTLTMTRGHGV